MKQSTAFLFLLAAVLTGCLTDLELPGKETGGQQFDFENDPVGVLPQGWSQHGVGSGLASWKIVSGDRGRVLAQTIGANPNRHFNIAVWDALITRDVTLQVRLRSVSGTHDQGGGFVWRFQDPNNHYIVRANPLENNVVAYKMENGTRTDLPLLGQGRTYGMKTGLLDRGWHALKLTAQRDLFTVYLDEQLLFQVQDRTFPGPGKVGLWTKADAVTWFDDFSIMNP